ncbi:MAG: NusG domain II-containing protein [Clostridia bacterium]|nr:NusG domain II-containing protein [Clostridia bacterium]
MGDEKKSKSKIKNDIIFIAVILAVVCAIGFIYISTRAPGDTVTVTVDGKFFGEYPLSVDRTVEIKTNEKVNILIIEGGKAHIKEATCPDGICTAHKPISRDGESIVCLPNKVVIIVSATGEDTPDIVV